MSHIVSGPSNDPVKFVKNLISGFPPDEERDIYLEVLCEEHKLTPEQRQKVEDSLWAYDKEYYKIHPDGPIKKPKVKSYKFPKVDTTLPLRAALMTTLEETFPHTFWVSEWSGIRIEVTCAYELGSGWRDIKKAIMDCIFHVLRAFKHSIADPHIIIKKSTAKKAKKQNKRQPTREEIEEMAEDGFNVSGYMY